MFQENIDKKNNWLRLKWLRQRLAEAETEITHLLSEVILPSIRQQTTVGQLRKPSSPHSVCTIQTQL